MNHRLYAYILQFQWRKAFPMYPYSEQVASMLVIWRKLEYLPGTQRTRILPNAERGAQINVWIFSEKYMNA